LEGCDPEEEGAHFFEALGDEGVGCVAGKCGEGVGVGKDGLGMVMGAVPVVLRLGLGLGLGMGLGFLGLRILGFRL